MPWYNGSRADIKFSGINKISIDFRSASILWDVHYQQPIIFEWQFLIIQNHIRMNTY